ncbi:MAG: efflux RND transporter periplasmic adaptor subunit [Saprospiraceae bacterium]
MKKYITFYLLGSLSLSLISCEIENSAPATTETDSLPTVGIETTPETTISISPHQFKTGGMAFGQLSATEFPTTIKATGVLEVPPKSQAAVSTVFGGYITQLNLITGEWVKRGQVLFNLKNPIFIQLQQEYLEAKEKLIFLSADYERQRTLAGENIASQKNFLRAESDYKVTVAQAAGLQKKLALLNINTDKLTATDMTTTIPVVAPISGYITEIQAITGQFLDPTDVALTLTATQHLHVELQVFEKDILRIKKGQAIQFRIPDGGQQTYAAEVYLINPMVDKTKRTVNVLGHLKTATNQQNFVMGMYVEADIVTTSSPAGGLPAAAVVAAGDRHFVLVKTGSSNGEVELEQREVQVGATYNGRTEIRNASVFSPQDSVLITGAFNLIAEE